MAIVVVATLFPVPEHRAEVIAALETAAEKVHARRTAACSTRCTRGPTAGSS